MTSSTRCAKRGSGQSNVIGPNLDRSLECLRHICVQDIDSSELVRYARRNEADLIGKGRHIRTVPIPDWVAAAVHAWLAEAAITEGAAFRAINKAGRIAATGFSPKVIWAWSSKHVDSADSQTLRRTI